MVQLSISAVRSLRESRMSAAIHDPGQDIKDTLARLEPDFDDNAFQFVDWLIWVWRQT